MECAHKSLYIKINQSFSFFVSGKFDEILNYTNLTVSLSTQKNNLKPVQHISIYNLEVKYIFKFTTVWSHLLITSTKLSNG